MGRLARATCSAWPPPGGLAAHFALWNASLGLTTVAAATTLVSCAPLFVGVGSVFLGRRRAPRLGRDRPGHRGRGGHRPPKVRRWSGAVLGDGSPSRGLAMAAYLLLGRVARQRLPVSTYATSVYGVAAAVLLPACLLTGSSPAATRPRPGWPWPGWWPPSCSATPCSTACWPP